MSSWPLSSGLLPFYMHFYMLGRMRTQHPHVQSLSPPPAYTIQAFSLRLFK